VIELQLVVDPTTQVVQDAPSGVDLLVLG